VKVVVKKIDKNGSYESIRTVKNITQYKSKILSDFKGKEFTGDINGNHVRFYHPDGITQATSFDFYTEDEWEHRYNNIEIVNPLKK